MYRAFHFLILVESKAVNLNYNYNKEQKFRNMVEPINSSEDESSLPSENESSLPREYVKALLDRMLALM